MTSRIWEIREKHKSREHEGSESYRTPHREQPTSYRGMREGEEHEKDELEEAYECGFEDGFKAAKMKGYFSERGGGMR